jgi:hypothetical protein
MAFQQGLKFRSLLEFWEHLPENERLITDVLRQVIIEKLPAGTRERLCYNVPFYYGKRRICLVWPASVPGGGIKEGVLLGFCQGHKLRDPGRYLVHGTNKRVYYRIFHSLDEIDEDAMVSVLDEAVAVDRSFR